MQASVDQTQGRRPVVKAKRQAGVVAALAVLGTLTGVASSQSTGDRGATPTAQKPPVPPAARFSPGPVRSSGMPRTRAAVPSRDGLDVWKRVPRIGIDSLTEKPPRPSGPTSPSEWSPGTAILLSDGLASSPRGFPQDRQDRGGVSVSGSYSDDHFRINASMSSAIADSAYRNWIGADNRSYYSPYSLVGCAGNQCGYNSGSSWGWGYDRFWRSGSCPTNYFRYWGIDPLWGRARVGSPFNTYYGSDPALDVNYQPSQAPQPSAPPAPPPTPDEIARLAMSLGRYPEAVDALKRHLKDNPSDPAAMRRLGIAQLLARKWDDGFAQIARAYQADPVLSDVPLTSEELGVREDVLRELTGRVVSRARQGRSRDAWMTAAILMQSRDKNEQAITMLEAAKNAGMDATLHARMRQSLSR